MAKRIIWQEISYYSSIDGFASKPVNATMNSQQTGKRAKRNKLLRTVTNGGRIRLGFIDNIKPSSQRLSRPIHLISDKKT